MFKKPMQTISALLALTAVLLLSVLPGGMILKRAGACGQELCLCLPQTSSVELPVKRCCEKHASAPLRLVYDSSATDAAFESGHGLWSFELVLNGLTFTEKVTYPSAASEWANLSVPELYVASYPIPFEQIPTPPPRT